MNVQLTGETWVRGLGRRNVLLGKNGCGKSQTLRQLEQAIQRVENFGVVRYLSPERGGQLAYEPGIEHQITSSMGHLADSRRRNLATQFRQQSAAQFRILELLTLREIESDTAVRSDPSITFDQTLEPLNALLDRVSIRRSSRGAFDIVDKNAHHPINPDALSSGESELISLGIECLVFERECVSGKENWLLIDEPDVHLHPDLQARFCRFIDGLLERGRFSIVIATHSTALLGAMDPNRETRVAFMKHGDRDVEFTTVADVHRKVLPVFGAHPLSNVFNEAPILLLEGEDDERIWQQAVRSSQGAIRIFPCEVGGLPELGSFEKEVARILEAVYDAPVGYSLRDGDGIADQLSSLGPLRRLRLACRASENLLLSDEVLAALNTSWETLHKRIENWITDPNYKDHPHLGSMRAFADSAFDRRNGNLKMIRNDLMGLLGSSKPWEIVVGKAIAALPYATTRSPSKTGLASFLGDDVCEALLAP